MKLYVTYWDAKDEDAEGGTITGAAWTTSASDASTAVTDACKQHNLRRKEVKTASIEVDTRKEGLIEFLNSLTNGVKVVVGIEKLVAS